MQYHLSSAQKKIAQKYVIVLLIFAFFITPLTPVLADMESDALAPVSVPAPSDTPSAPAPDIAAPAVDVLSPAADNAAAAALPDGLTPPDVAADVPITTMPDNADKPVKPERVAKDKNPKNSPNNDTQTSSPLSASASSADSTSATQDIGQSVQPKKTIIPESDPSTGALVYNYPIATPPGRNGMQPDLQLRYNSQDTTQDSIFGFGWSLNIPYIARVNKKGTNTLFTDNYFTSSLSGELANISGSNYASKVENGDFLKYTFISDTWTATDKSGTMYTFGEQNSSRQDNPGDATQVYKWMLEKAQDQNGNFITYSYFKDAGQIYPDTIAYTGNAAVPGIFSVVFTRETRSDAMQSSAPGFIATTNYRISQIQTLVSGVWARKYVLAYGIGANEARSILASATESGKDINNIITTLPATTFSYQAQNPGWTYDNSWTLPVPLYGKDGENRYGDYGTRALDINSDGLVDIVSMTLNGINQPVTSKVYLNNGIGWVYDPLWILPIPLLGRDRENSYNDFGTRTFDVNGDGLVDIVSMTLNGINQPITSKVWLNDGTGWNYDASWILPVPLYGKDGENRYGDYGTRALDINGDGLVDIVSMTINGTNQPITSRVYVNTGTGWNYDASWILPVPLYGNIGGYLENGNQTLDVNGDGLIDIVSVSIDVLHNYKVDSKVWLNDGTGWNYDASWILPVPLYGKDGNHMLFETGTRTIDINGDGLTDIVSITIDSSLTPYNSSTPYPVISKVWINTGTGWNYDASWILPVPLSSKDGANAYGGDYGTRTLDINGDGLVDIVSISIDTFWPYKVNSKVWLNNTKQVDPLNQIILPAGGGVDIAYKPSAQYKDAAGNLSNPKLPFVVQTVNTITATDLVNNVSSVDTYTYANGSFYFESADPFTKKFAGFGVITKTNLAGNSTKTYFHQGDLSNASQGEYQDDYWKIGKVYRTQATDATGNLYQKTINKWDDVGLGNGARFVALAQTLSQTYDGNTTHKDIAQSYAYNNSNGNVTQKTQWGEVAGSDDGTFSDTGNDKFTTNYAYASGGSVVALPSQTTTIDQNAINIKESKFYYDSQVFGIATKGNLTKQEDWKSGTSYISNQKSYDSYGLVINSTDPRANTTQYTYETHNLYPAIVVNPLTHTTQYAYDYATGQVTQKTDINGRVFQYAYDGLGRLTQEKQPDLADPSMFVIKATYDYTDTPNAASAKKSSYLDAATVADSYAYFDGLGRKIQERQESEGANFSTKDYTYNNLGQLQKESLSYFSAGPNKTSPTGNAAFYTAHTYDPVNRVAASANAVGATTNTYNDWKTTVTDANGKSKDFYKDAYGNLAQMDEHNLSAAYSAFYNYNYFGSITKLTDAQGNIRNFTYDGLGQRLTAQDLHAPADATFGSYVYTYDDAGNLTQTIDPKRQIVNYAYDSLNRQLSENDDGQAGVEVTNTYDTGIDGKGRLAGFVSPIMTQANTYNALGLVKTELKAIKGVPYLTVYDYDRQGNQTIVTNPDNSQIKNIYNSAGLLEQVQRKEEVDADFINVVSNFDYSPLGQVTVQTNANGTITTNTYDAAKLYRLTNKVTTIAGQVRGQDLAYAYDNVGNIVSIVDTSATAASKTSQYGYDDLYRLTSATVSNVAAGQAPYNQTFTYDAIGNIVTKTETLGVNPEATFTYAYAGNTGASYANPHAATSVTAGANATNYFYDNNGNMTQEGDRQHTFDYNNRLIKSSVPASGTTILAPSAKTFYSTAGDGSVRYGASDSWPATHDASVGIFANYKATTLKVNSGKNNTNKYEIQRAFFPFNTSSLPDNATITSATLKVYVHAKSNGNNDNLDWVSVVSGSESSAYSLIKNDYNKTGSIEGIDTVERKDITNVTIGQYMVFNFNDTGKGWISKTGFTKLALREGHDVINTSFAGSINQYNELIIRTTEYSGAASDPVLEITYTTPPPAISITYGYDPFGQRVKVSNGKIATTYPTKFYNSASSLSADNTITKHLFAGAQDIATIQGTGAGAKVYHNAADLLNSSSVMTDSAGAISETMDYFPFGAIRIDNKTGTFAEQRKYIGQEYDADTGLNYLNARYYSATLARFISQDPVFWGKQNLADPQNQNSYAYARNNPIAGSDPSGLKAYFTPGFAQPLSGRTTVNDPGVQGVMSWMVNQFGSAEFYGWSQQDNTRAFNAAAQGLASRIMSENKPGDPIDLIAHSDGGIVDGKAAQILESNGYDVRNVVMGGTPVRKGDFDTIGVDNVVMAYNTDDPVQVGGGNFLNMSAVLGVAAGFILSGGNPMGGIAGFMLGYALNKGEYGSAGRTISGADNVNVTKSINESQRKYGGIGPFYEHSATIFESAARDQITSHLKK